MMLLALPADVLEVVATFLPLRDVARLAATCRYLHAVVRPHVGRAVVSLWEGEVGMPWTPAVVRGVLKECMRLKTLDLHGIATDPILLGVAESAHPHLETVIISSAELVSDVGAVALVSALPQLRLVDATFCLHVTHEVVLFARLLSITREAHGGKPLLVQRLPAWFARPWLCESHAQIPTGEVHDYRLDGTFQFSRDIEAHGQVWSFSARHGQPWFDLYVEYTDIDLLPQLVNGVADDLRPRWTVRPGVCVRPLSPDTMMSVQSRRGTHPPAIPPEEDDEFAVIGIWRALDQASFPTMT